MGLLQTDTLSFLTAIFLVIASYGISLSTYRLFLHLLASFPGPKLAGLTYWYDFYFEVIKLGKLHKQLAYLHEKYGPIIRISPDELHVSDPEFWNEFYVKQGPQSKYKKTAVIFNQHASTFSALDHDLHKSRRAAMEGLFTKSSVRQLLPVLHEKTAILLARLGEYIKTGKPARVDRAFWALSEDIIFEYGFGIERNTLDSPDFSAILHQVFVQAGSAGKIGQPFPIVPKIFDALPDWIVMKLQPDFIPLMQLKRVFMSEYEALISPNGSVGRSNRLGNSVMLQVFNHPSLPDSEKSSQRIRDESQLVIGGGLSTVGWAATVGTYHILKNPQILNRMREELFTVIPKGKKRKDCTDLEWNALEALPYFQACIKEAIRLSYGMSSRGARITPKDVIYTEADYYTEYKKSPRTWRIPAYTPVSMSSVITSHVEHVFKNSYEYNPERWLGPDKLSDKYFVALGKGSRACLGIQLAMAEMNLIFASVFRWYDMELHDTDEKCVSIFSDFGIPVPERQDGVKVVMKGEID